MTRLGVISPIITLLGVISPKCKSARVEKCYRSAHLWGNFANVEPCLWGNFANAACYLNRYLWEAAEKLIFQKKYLKFVAMILNSLHLISSLYKLYDCVFNEIF